MGFKDCCVFCLLDLLVFIVFGRMFGFASTREKRSWFDMEWLDLWRTTKCGYWGGVWLAEVSSTRDVDYYCSFGVLLPSPSILWIHLQWDTRIIEHNEVQTSCFNVSELGRNRRRSWLRWCSVNAFARSVMMTVAAVWWERQADHWRPEIRCNRVVTIQYWDIEYIGSIGIERIFYVNRDCNCKWSGWLSSWLRYSAIS